MVVPVARLELDTQDPVGSFFGQHDITSYVRSWGWRAGRSTETDTQQAATASVTLDNRDGRFSSVNTAGPYYPNLIPHRRMRMWADVATGPTAFTVRRSATRQGHVIRGGPTESFPIFTMFITSLAQTWDPSNADAICAVSLTDAFAILAEAPFELNWSGSPVDELAGARINRVLDYVGWPAEDRLIDPGTVTILGSNTVFGGSTEINVSDSALNHMLQVADTEGGWLFVDGLGRIRFIDAAHEPVLNTMDVYGGGAGEQPFRDIEAPTDESRIWNIITVATTQPALVAAEDAEDATSKRRHFGRPRTFTILPALDPDTGNTRSMNGRRLIEILTRYRYSRARLPRLEFIPTTLAGWRHVLARERADRVRVRKRPAGLGTLEQDGRLEGREISAPDQADWTMRWQLSDTIENLASAQQTSPENTTDGWGDTVNCALSAAGPSIVGGDALVLTSAAAGDMSARMQPDTDIPVEEGKRYIATAYFRPAISTPFRTVRVEINWRDATGANLSTSAGTGVVETTTQEWVTQAIVEAVAPASAAFATVRIVVVGTGGASEVHRVDLIAICGST